MLLGLGSAIDLSLNPNLVGSLIDVELVINFMVRVFSRALSAKWYEVVGVVVHVLLG